MKIVIDDEPFKIEDGPILILAGPGTGKTFQLANRIKYLTGKGVNPEEIIVITFTSEAAKSMAKKIRKEGGNEYIEEEKRPKKIMTMHSFGLSILKENRGLLNLSDNFSVVSSEVLRRCLIRDAALALGFSERDAYQAHCARTTAADIKSVNITKILDKYEEILRACDAIDFDDQIQLASIVLRNKGVIESITKGTKYLLIDEFQDINPAQFDFISLLASKFPQGIFAVGDDDQSIYGFRGGTPEYIRNFHKYFGESSKIIQMQKSRRCLCNILDCALSVVENNDPERVPKKPPVYLEEESGEVEVHSCPTDDTEAKVISAIIQEEISKNNKVEIFIIIPNKNFLEKIKKSLNKNDIAFDAQYAGFTESWSKFELAKNISESLESSLRLRENIEFLLESNATGLPSSRSKTPKKLAERESGMKEIATLWEDVLSKNKTLWDALAEKSSKSSLFEELKQKILEIKSSYESDLQTFVIKVLNLLKPWSTTGAFLKDIDRILQSSKTDNVSYELRILTPQKSKGLEADVVIAIGLEDDPRRCSAEDARLFFVAMTRARQKLLIFWSRNRSGSSSFRSNSFDLKPSKFLNGLPKEKYKAIYHQAPSKIKNEN